MKLYKGKHANGTEEDASQLLVLLLHHLGNHGSRRRPDAHEPAELATHALPDALTRLLRAALNLARPQRTVDAQLVDPGEPPADQAGAEDSALVVDGAREAGEERVPRVDGQGEEVAREGVPGGGGREGDFEAADGGREGVEEGKGRRGVADLVLGGRDRRGRGLAEGGEEGLGLGDVLVEGDADAAPDVLLAEEVAGWEGGEDGAFERVEGGESGGEGGCREEGFDRGSEGGLVREESGEDGEEGVL